MPSLTKEQLTQINERLNLETSKYKNFVETGTHYANTIQNLLNEFDEIHSIELSTKFYNRAKSIFETVKKVNLHQGDSTHQLPLVIKKLEGPSVFFLDGHYSSEDTAKGEKDVPLIEELNSIVNDFEFECLIIIDDLRLFGTNVNEDWSDITEDSILQSVESRLIKSEKINDRFIMILKSKN